MKNVISIASAGLAALVLSASLLTGCGGGSAGTTPSLNPGVTRSVQTTMAAGMKALVPAATDTLSGRVNTAHLGVSAFDRTYSVSTPAGEDFSFSVVANRFGNTGETKVSVAHAANGTATPVGGAETLTQAGLRIEAPGVDNTGAWINVTGDGFARVGISGRIDQNQVIVIEVPQPEGGKETIGVEIVIGPPSDITVVEAPVDGDADVKSDQTIYSSDSWHFGLPAIATSGDRVSVVAYDGNAADPDAWERRRRWLQVDTATQAVTGGEASSTSADWGFWRDQEIASLGNVIAIVYTGNGQVRTDISLDRGASFGIEHLLDSEQTGFGQRLVQVGIANDYRLGFVFWRSQGNWMTGDSVSELVLVEAIPGALDATNTPTSYTFQAPVVLSAPGKHVTPLVMDVKYNDGRDLAIGYGYTEFVPLPGDLTMGVNRALFRCAVRLDGGVINDRLVDTEENIVPMDPSVALVGSGASMQIFYSYEKSTGIQIRRSTDAGASFTHVVSTGSAGAYLPSVHARMQGAELRVDVLYLEPTENGAEVHSRHWDDFITAPGTHRVLRLTTATREDLPGGTVTDPSAPFFIREGGMPSVRITEVAAFGYDAVDDGDDVVVVIHQRTQDTWFFWGMDARIGIMPPMFLGEGAGVLAPSAGAAAPPPVLLPGLTGSVPAPTPTHANQLKLLVVN